MRTVILTSLIVLLVGIQIGCQTPARDRKEAAPAATAETNPFFVFDNGLRGENLKTIASQLDLAKEIGFAGLAWRTDAPDHVKEVLDGSKQRGMKLFVIYANLDLKDGKMVYDPRLKEIIALCKGTDTMIWPNMTSKQFKPSDPAGDDIAVAGLRELADLCDANGLRIAIYPHVNMWVHRVEDAVRVVKKVDRKNVGVTFNLCHALLDEAESRIPVLIKEVAPHMFVATINGADSGASKKEMGRMIQPLDKGTYDVGIVLRKLKAVGFKGPIGLQCYNINGDPKTLLTGSMSAWRKLSEVPNTLTAKEKAAGWQLLFDGQSLAGWRAYKTPKGTGEIGAGWKVEDGLLKKLAGVKGGDIITEKQFDDFELTWEWRIEKGGNNGVKYFVTEARPQAPGHEYQMLDDEFEKWAKMPAKDHTASFYQVLPPVADKGYKPAGEWNCSRILIKGNHVEHWLNGKKAIEYELGSEAVKTAVAESKFKKYPDFGQKIKGHIMLTDHTDEAWFRNIKLRELSAK
ncbi:MAG: DUF1080 domain-containing protein [Verrucomicrobia bacterium]|nr:DUF1080 domain-containing protein [Verrucomicrobiota bacterium]